MLELIKLFLLYISISFWEYEYCNSSEVKGKYLIAINIVEVCENYKYKNLVAIHELWHYFWFTYLSKEEKAIYEIMFINSWWFNFVTSYAETDVVEDFAETFTSALVRELKIENRYSISTSYVIRIKIDYVKWLAEKHKNKAIFNLIN